MVDFLFVIIELFVIFYGWDVISGNLSSRRFSKGVGHFDGRGRRPSPSTIHRCCQKLDWLPFRVVSSIHSALFGFVTKHARALKTPFLCPDGRVATSEGRLAQWGTTKFVLPHWASRPTKLATKQALVFTVIQLTKAYVCCNLYFLLVSRSVPATAW